MTFENEGNQHQRHPQGHSVMVSTRDFGSLNLGSNPDALAQLHRHVVEDHLSYMG